MHDAIQPDSPPRRIQLHRRSAALSLEYSDAECYRLSAEYLRVYSPSAEVRGHGSGQERLQVGKREVGIERIERMGHYAIRIHFDDGHDSGIYSWPYLYRLCREQEALWQAYLDALQRAGARRDPLPAGVQAINIMPSGDPPTQS